MLSFCTYFDEHYLSRGLALYRSLKEHCSAFQLWILCMDDASYVLLSRLDLPEIHLIALDDFECGDKELLCAKQNRTRIEYYFTCTPSLPLYILNHAPEVDLITYLDADLYFFANPTDLYKEIGNSSIAIIAHRFPPCLRERVRFGVYNVGWLSFRRDEHAFQCLRWWRERCLEWCYDRYEEGRYADQKYLDDWPDLFQGVVVLQHKGANLAPWNLGNYQVSLKGGQIRIDDQILVFHHFHGFRQLKTWLYDPGLALYGTKPSRVILWGIYVPYLRVLLDVNRCIAPLLQVASCQADIRGQLRAMPPSPQHLALLHRTISGLWEVLRIGQGILNKGYITVVDGRILQIF